MDMLPWHFNITHMYAGFFVVVIEIIIITTIMIHVKHAPPMHQIDQAPYPNGIPVTIKCLTDSTHKRGTPYMYHFFYRA